MQLALQALAWPACPQQRQLLALMVVVRAQMALRKQLQHSKMQRRTYTLLSSMRTLRCLCLGCTWPAGVQETCTCRQDYFNRQWRLLQHRSKQVQVCQCQQMARQVPAVRSTRWTECTSKQTQTLLTISRVRLAALCTYDHLSNCVIPTSTHSQRSWKCRVEDGFRRVAVRQDSEVLLLLVQACYQVEVQ